MIPTKFGGHNVFTARPLIAFDHVAQQRFTFTGIESVARVEKVDATLKRGFDDGFTGRFRQLGRIIVPNSETENRDFQTRFT
jgi:hypothetical protein